MTYLAQAFEKYQHTSGTLQNAIYHALKDAVLHHQVPDEIAESQISLDLSVSRTPVREAMHKLSNEGLLEISHGRKARVKNITKQDVKDIAVILRSLHSTVVELCIQNATDEELNELDKILDYITFFTQRRDMAKITAYNSQLHLKICELAKNKWLYDIMTKLLDYTFVFRETAVSRADRTEVALQEHIHIVELLKRRDVEQARRFIVLHVDAAHNVDSL